RTRWSNVATDDALFRESAPRNANAWCVPGAIVGATRAPGTLCGGFGIAIHRCRTGGGRFLCSGLGVRAVIQLQVDREGSTTWRNDVRRYPGMMMPCNRAWSA